MTATDDGDARVDEAAAGETTSQEAAAPAPRRSFFAPADLRARLLRGPWSWLLAFPVVISAWSHTYIRPTAGLDQGVIYGLTKYMRGQVHGNVVDYTYGPLGPLNWVFDYDRRVFVVEMFWALGVVYLMALLTMRRCRRWMPWPVAVIPAWFAVQTVDNGGIVEAAALVAVLLVAEQWDELLSRRVVLPALVVGAPVLLLTKPTTGLIAYVVGIVSVCLAVHGLKRQVVTSAVFTAAAGVVGLIIWVLLGVPLGQIPSAIRASVQFASGYDIVANEQDNSGYEYYLVLVLFVLMVALVASRSSRRLAALVVIGLAFYLDFRHGFVRHDAHSLGFFSAVVLLVVAAAPPDPKVLRFPNLAPVALTASLGLAFGQFQPYAGGLHHLGVGQFALRQQLKMVVSGSAFAKQVALDDTLLQGQAQISPPLLDIIGNSTVTLESYSDAYLWAYGLNWAPIPTLQPLAGYTEPLDTLNADFVASSHAPQYMLRNATAATIDAHWPLADSGGYQLAVMCYYHQVALAGQWRLLEHGPSTCGAPTSLGAPVTVHAGQDITVPSPATAGDVVYATIHTHPGAYFDLRKTFFKTTTIPHMVLDGNEYRLIWTADGQPTVLDAPVGLSGEKVTTSTMSFTDMPGTMTVSFTEVPLGQ